MPYPIALAAGAALSLAGTGMGMAANAKAGRAMDNAQADELARQRGFRDKSAAEFNQSLGKSGVNTANDQLAEGEDARKSAYSKLSELSLAGSPQTGSQAVQTVSTPGAKQNQASVSRSNNAWSKMVGGAQAKLGGYQDWGLQQGIKNQRTSQNLSTIGNKARGSASVLPMEMQDASHKGDSLKNWGTLLQSLGFLSGAAGAAGLGIGAAPSAGVTTAGAELLNAPVGTTFNTLTQQALKPGTFNPWPALVLGSG